MYFLGDNLVMKHNIIYHSLFKYMMKTDWVLQKNKLTPDCCRNKLHKLHNLSSTSWALQPLIISSYLFQTLSYTICFVEFDATKRCQAKRKKKEENLKRWINVLPSLSCSANMSSTTRCGGSISRHCSTDRKPCLSNRPSTANRSKYRWYSTMAKKSKHWSK